MCNAITLLQNILYLVFYPKVLYSNEKQDRNMDVFYPLTQNFTSPVSIS